MVARDLDKYVNEGLIQFVTGQYSSGLPLTVILGYVMNAKTDVARRDPGKAMALRLTSLSYNTCLCLRACYRNNPYFADVAVDRYHLI